MSNPSDTKKIWSYINKIAKERNADADFVYRWCIERVCPPKEYRMNSKVVDGFIEFWESQGKGFTAQKELDSNGTDYVVRVTKGISGFSESETDSLIRLLQDVADACNISLLSREEEERYLSYL